MPTPAPAVTVTVETSAQPVGVEGSIARVKPSHDRGPVGLAFALDEEHVVTCAHVVNLALAATADRSFDDSSLPRRGVALEFGLGGSQPGPPPPRWAKVAVWLPSDADDGDDPFEAHDVAILRLDGDRLPPGVVLPMLVRGQRQGKVQMFGPHPGPGHEVHVEGILRGPVQGRRLQIDVDVDNALRVVEGFSGGPVWCQGTGRVVGMLHSGGQITDDPRDVYAVQSEVIADAWKEHLPDRTPPRIFDPTTPRRPRLSRPERPRPPKPPKPPRSASRRAGNTPMSQARRDARLWTGHSWLIAVSVVSGIFGVLRAVDRAALGWAVVAGVGVGLLVHVVGVLAGVVLAPARDEPTDPGEPDGPSA